MFPSLGACCSVTLDNSFLSPSLSPFCINVEWIYLLEVRKQRAETVLEGERDSTSEGDINLLSVFHESSWVPKLLRHATKYLDVHMHIICKIICWSQLSDLHQFKGKKISLIEIILWMALHPCKLLRYHCFH